MRVSLSPGSYVLAVSGGVDSMVLMDLLAKKAAGFSYVVAHFNHGIRGDAAKDAEFVRVAAGKYGLRYVTKAVRLGSHASEETAREARYAFLRKVQNEYKSKAIITAHHRDDVIETAFINLLRGTNRHGLTSMQNSDVVRPLLKYPKSEIIRYAKLHGLVWREDSTNNETIYLRNYIRKNVISRLSPAQIDLLAHNIDKMSKVNAETNKIIAILSQSVSNEGAIKRAKFSLLPARVGEELMVYWLRREKTCDFNKSMIYRLSNAVKTARPNTRHDILDGLCLNVGLTEAHFVRSA